MMAEDVRRWATISPDRARDRTYALNQLLLGAVTLAMSILAILTGRVDDEFMLLIGMVAMFVMTGVALAVPWNAISPWWGVALPLVDIAAIALLNAGSGAVEFGLLWVFPVIWLAGTFGVLGLVLAIIIVVALYWIGLALGGLEEIQPRTITVPLLIVALAVISHIATRRSTAQRLLLEKQASALARTVTHLRQQEDLLTQVLDAVDFGVIRIGPDGTETLVNEAFVRLQDAAGALGARTKPADRIVYADDGVTPLAPIDQPLTRARAGETFESEMVWYGAPGGHRRAVVVTARALSAPDRTRLGSIVVLRDVTAEVNALRARDDLVASVSHELRTPLTSVLGYLELVIDDGSVSPTVRRQLRVAERNAQRLLNMVSDILDSTARERAAVPLTVHPATASLDAVAWASIEAFTPRAAVRGITIDGSGIVPVTADFDARRIRQVIDNLISNAIKYGREGGRIVVRVEADAANAWVIVQDNGVGISAAEVPSLFDRFFRADAVRHTSTHGSGLGLAISRDIARSHGGDITAQSVLGEGSTFVVRLPRRMDADVDGVGYGVDVGDGGHP